MKKTVEVLVHFIPVRHEIEIEDDGRPLNEQIRELARAGAFEKVKPLQITSHVEPLY